MRPGGGLDSDETAVAQPGCAVDDGAVAEEHLVADDDRGQVEPAAVTAAGVEHDVVGDEIGGTEADQRAEPDGGGHLTAAADGQSHEPQPRAGVQAGVEREQHRPGAGEDLLAGPRRPSGEAGAGMPTGAHPAAEYLEPYFQSLVQWN